MTDWDKRYREGLYGGEAQPHTLLMRFWSLFPAAGRIVDIASGTGRDVLFLAGKGLDVYGLERSGEGLRIARQRAIKGDLTVTFIQADAYHLPVRTGSADGVIVFYFLAREIMGELVSILKPGGLLIYETYLKRQNSIDRPRNPDYLLDDGELLEYFRRLDLIFYEEGVYFIDGKRRALARYVGRNA